METLQPGHYWKTPFYWEPGCPEPPPDAGRLVFAEPDEEWLRMAIGRVMEEGTDESDRYTVPLIGLAAAVDELYEILPRYFERPAAWWRMASDAGGRPVGFVLPVRFKEDRFWKERRPQGTILYMGVLPESRGNGYATDLVHEATHIFLRADCWRVFCDTGSDNAAMVKAFRNAGYTERQPWQRPLR